MSGATEADILCKNTVPLKGVNKGGNWGLGLWSLTPDSVPPSFQPYPECLKMELEPWNQWLKYYNTVPITFCNFCFTKITIFLFLQKNVFGWVLDTQGWQECSKKVASCEPGRNARRTSPVPPLALYVQSPESWEIVFWLNYPKCDDLLEWPAMVWIWFERCFLEFSVFKVMSFKSLQYSFVEGWGNLKLVF